MSFTVMQAGQFEQNGNWKLARRSLGVRSLGLNVVEIPAGESIPEHDELDRDQEEVFVVLAGDTVLVIDGEEHFAPAGTYARVDVEHKRTVRNDGTGTASVLIISAPCSSGYEPMGWA